MHVEAETVAEPVAHRAAKRARVDHVAGEGVRLDAGDAGADTAERRILGKLHDFVRLAQLLVERAGRERARVVGRVPADRAACVDDDELVLPDFPVTGAAVRLRACRP